jgi:uncharacterized membrane protein (UPF0182 family)
VAFRIDAPKRPRFLLPVLGVLLVLVVVATVGVAVYTDLLWFRETGFEEVFSTRLQAQSLLFTLGGLLVATAVGANIVIANRLRPPFTPSSLEQRNLERYRVALQPWRLRALLAITGFVGLISGAAASGRWQTWLAWRHAVTFGVEDPQFGRDASYYMFSYPFQRLVLGFLFAAAILSLLAAGATHYLYGGIRLQTRGEKVLPTARAHLSVLLGVIVLLKAVAYYLDQYGLNFSPRGVVSGASYTDVTAKLPALRILIAISLICAALFFANVRARNWALPATGFGLLLFSAVVIGGVVPAAVQQFRVKPNEVAREKEYIERSLSATRDAYGIDEVDSTEYPAAGPITPTTVRTDQATIPNVRLLDPNLLQPAFEQLQQLRGYFGFANGLDIDRYSVDGRVQDFVVSVREIDHEGLAENQQNWINQKLTYTHGYGFVAAPVNKVSAKGEPVFSQSDFESAGGIDVSQPRIYYGEQAPAYSVVGTEQGEVDKPGGEEDQEQASFTYDGNGGVSIEGTLRRLAYATRFRDRNLLLSGAIGARSKIMYIRDPRDRVAKVAPYLQLDRDPYPAVVDGRIVWIVDGYTSSDRFPYSASVPFGDVTQDSQGRAQPAREINYIRNSVKATVDAYDGDVTLYQWDAQDPVLRTWARVFPGTLRPRSEMSQELLAHVHYPEDMFKVQRDLISRYHVTSAAEFYSGEDFWAVPTDPNAGREGSRPDQPPFYLRLQLPGQDKPRFQLTSPMVARRRPNLTAFLSASSEPDDYGKLRILRLPRNTNIEGPEQQSGRFQRDPDASEFRTLLGQQGSNIEFGNLLTLPFSGGLLFVQPIYVSSTEGAGIPALTRVLVGTGASVGFGETLSAALADLFGSDAAPPESPDGPDEPTSPTTGEEALQKALADAQKAYADGQAALAKGDFAAYGAAQRRLKDALDRAAAASGATPSASPSPSPSRSP